MKKLLFTLLFLPAIAFAGVFYMPNNAGGEIVITDRSCYDSSGTNHKYLRSAYAWSPEGYVIRGCWGLIDGKVNIIFESGDERVFAPEQFYEKKSERKQNNKSETVTF
jgi:hypothetical protein